MRQETSGMEKVLIAGCGYVGSRLAELLVQDGIGVWGLKRNPSSLPAGVERVPADVTDPATLKKLPAVRFDAVVYAVSPAGRTEDAYQTAYVDGPRNVLSAVEARQSPVGRVLLVSSTGVFGFRDGRQVDEDTDPEPADSTAERVLEGEGLVRSRWGGVAVRLGGIYGPGRTRTVRRVMEGKSGCPPADQYGNRIHQEDAAGALRHLLRLPDPHSLYLGVDRDPAPLREVYRWVAEQAGIADPCAQVEEEAWLPHERRGTNKRCSNQRLLDSGYEFRYPTFRDGYRTLLGG